MKRTKLQVKLQGVDPHGVIDINPVSASDMGYVFAKWGEIAEYVLEKAKLGDEQYLSWHLHICRGFKGQDNILDVDVSVSLVEIAKFKQHIIVEVADNFHILEGGYWMKHIGSMSLEDISKRIISKFK